jgi:hypothetical protein
MIENSRVNLSLTDEILPASTITFGLSDSYSTTLFLTCNADAMKYLVLSLSR